MKTDARLSSQALRNVNDGISMISIINGALDAQKDILYRMAELAEQSANGVMSSAQRKPLQAEYRALQEEFDRVASAAKFNGISLLRNPDPTTIGLMAGITGTDNSLLTVAAANSHRFAGVLAQRSNWNTDNFVDGTDFSIENSYIQLNQFLDEKNIRNPRATEPAILTFVDSQGNEGDIYIQLSNTAGSFSFFLTGIPEEPTERRVITIARNSLGETATSNTIYDPEAKTININLTLSGSSATVNVNLDISGLSYQSRDKTGIVPLDVVEDAETRQTAIGFTGIYNSFAAKRALDTVKNRIEDLSKLQGQFGAVEARLSVAANQLSVNRENFSSAASQITDVDVASEAATLARTQILQQAATAVLAQANQQPGLALQLLGGF